MNIFLPTASESMISLLINQIQNLGRSPKGRRCPKNIISTCLDLYNRSPKSYECLERNHMLVLPSAKLKTVFDKKLDSKMQYLSGCIMRSQG